MYDSKDYTGTQITWRDTSLPDYCNNPTSVGRTVKIYDNGKTKNAKVIAIGKRDYIDVLCNGKKYLCHYDLKSQKYTLVK